MKGTRVGVNWNKSPFLQFFFFFILFCGGRGFSCSWFQNSTCIVCWDLCWFLQIHHLSQNLDESILVGFFKLWALVLVTAILLCCKIVKASLLYLIIIKYYNCIITASIVMIYLTCGFALVDSYTYAYPNL